MDTIRIFRIIEYVGPRNEVEKHFENVIQGTKTFYGIKINAVTIDFNEILESEEE